MLVLTDTKYLFFLSYSGNIPQPVFLEQGDSQVSLPCKHKFNKMVYVSSYRCVLNPSTGTDTQY